MPPKDAGAYFGTKGFGLLVPRVANRLNEGARHVLSERSPEEKHA
jgi:hypothetical protein